MAAIEASLTGRSVVYGVPEDAHAAIHRDTIYLFQEALGQYRSNGNELTQGVRRAQHEVCHKWWESLSLDERNASPDFGGSRPPLAPVRSLMGKATFVPK